MPRKLIVIPALDEEATVGAVVRSIRAELDADILVIDDGSTDRTMAEALAAGAKVLQHPYNLGVGAALRSGFRYAVANGYDAVMQVDADGQHDVEAAVRLLGRLEADGLDLVVGTRFGSEYDVGFVRRTSMRMLSRTVSRRLGVEINDTTSGFRAFGPGAALERFARSYPSAYLSDTVEALLMAGDWGLKVAEEPVQMRPRAGGKPSSGRIKSAFHLIRLSLVIQLHKVRVARPERAV